MANKVFDFIDAQDTFIFDLEKLLVETPALSPENGGQGEAQKAKMLEAFLKKQGFCDFVYYNAPDKRVDCGTRPNLVLNIAGKDKNRSLWFISHLDVVPPGNSDLWQTPAFSLTKKGDFLFGRGTEDNSQGLTSSVLAAFALKNSNVVPACNIKLLFCADEEVGSKYGVGYLLDKIKPFDKNDIIVIPDGGDKEGVCIEIAEKSILWLKIEITGKQAHASRPQEGSNAFLAACDMALKIHSLEKLFCKEDTMFSPPYSTFTPTMKAPGVENYNTIPGYDCFGVDCRILPCYPIDDIIKQIDTIATQIQECYKVKTKITTMQKAYSPATPATSKAVTKLSSAIKQVTGKNAKTIGIGGGTVAGSLRQAGFLDCVVWSSLDEMAHSPNEYCKISNLKKDAKVMAHLMQNC